MKELPDIPASWPKGTLRRVDLIELSLQTHTPVRGGYMSKRSLVILLEVGIGYPRLPDTLYVRGRQYVWSRNELSVDTNWAYRYARVS